MRRFVVLLLLLPALLQAQYPPWSWYSSTAGGAWKRFGSLAQHDAPFSFLQPQGGLYKDSLRGYWNMSDTLDHHTGVFPLKMFNMGNVFPDTVGVIGTACTFDNLKSQYLQNGSPQLGVMNGSFSVMWWERANAPSASLASVELSRGTGLSANTLEYGAIPQNTAYSARLYDGTTRQISSSPHTTVVWRHHSIVFDAAKDTLYYYMNGVEKGRTQVNGAVPGVGPFTIGGTGAGTYTWSGAIDEVYFWRGLAVTAAFVLAYYNSGSGQVYNWVIQQK